MGVTVIAQTQEQGRDATVELDAPVLVVGCGRRQRRDDQIGLAIARKLMARVKPGIVMRESESPAADILTELEGRSGVRLLVIIDAAVPGTAFAAGSLHRLVLGPQVGHSRVRILDRHFGKGAPSSHQLGVAEALRLGDALGLLPRETWVYAIAGGDFGYGLAFSRPVHAAIDKIAERIAVEIETWLREWRARHA